MTLYIAQMHLEAAEFYNGSYRQLMMITCVSIT